MQPGTWQAPATRGPVRATVPLPGSKSITNRALVLAALSSSPSVITGALQARDTSLAIAALRTLGVGIDDSSITTLSITPGSAVPSGAINLDVGNAGTVMRFLPPVAALTPATVSFDGDSRAYQRPVGPLLSALRALGVSVSGSSLPFVVTGSGSVPGGSVTMDASGSSQFVSSLLLAGASFENGVEIRHSGQPVPSLPHIDMTLRMLRSAGASVGSEGSSSWWVSPGPISLGSFAVEPDLSNAAPFLAAALVTGGSVTIPHWPADSLQAADQILSVLTAMGASVSVSPDGLTLTGSGTISGIEADLHEISELTPVVAACAALASSPSRLTGVEHIRRHETDRLAALAKEINALGGDVSELPDGLVVRPRVLSAAGRPFETYDDHRMVMAAAVLGLGVPGLPVSNVATVGKTFPSFTTAWASMLEQDH
jgi:3-phosphoshikimate 1-carboxyvinyltransferase